MGRMWAGHTRRIFIGVFFDLRVNVVNVGLEHAGQEPKGLASRVWMVGLQPRVRDDDHTQRPTRSFTHALELLERDEGLFWQVLAAAELAAILRELDEVARVEQADRAAAELLDVGKRRLELAAALRTPVGLARAAPHV